MMSVRSRTRMEVISIFGVIAAIIALGFFSEQIFKKTNIPDVLILIIVGIIIGSFLQWARPDDFGAGSTLFTTFALVFILFQGALNLDFRTLLNSLFSTVKLTVLSFVFTVIVVTSIVYVLFGDFMLAILVGMILGGTSSAVVIPLVKNLSMRKEYGLVLTLESAISDVLCIVGAITIINIHLTQQIVASGIFKTVLSSFALAILVGGVVGFIWILILNKFESMNNSYMVGIAVVIALYAFVESPFVEGSGAIAALAFGLVWGNAQPILHLVQARQNSKQEEAEYSTEEAQHNSMIVRTVLTKSAKNFYSEIGFFVKVFFFVYLGILIDFSNLSVFVYGIVLTLGIYLIRPLATKIVFKHDKAISLKETAILEVLIPKGLAAAVLAQLAVQSQFPGAGSVVNIVLSVVLLSIVLTSLLAFLAEKGWFTGFWRLFTKREDAE
jgi:cell volume regulation protein A